MELTQSRTSRTQVPFGVLAYAGAGLASRLCDHAHDGQILVSQRVLVEVEEFVTSTAVGNLQLKGLSHLVVVHNIESLLATA
jgi:class 3 adenylate cyclase